MDVNTLTDSKFGYWLNGIVPKKISRLCNDTRALQPDNCFVAIKTADRDGHAFLNVAKSRGASCAIVSAPNLGIGLPQFVCEDTEHAVVEIAKFARSRFTGTLVAITGSYGKTTTKDILKLLLGLKNNATFENKNGQLGVPMTLCCLRNDEKFAVVEVGVDAPNKIDRLIDLVQPTVAIMTGVTSIHIEEMKDEATIAHEKCKLLVRAIENGGFGIFNESLLQFDDFVQIKDRSVVVGEAGCGVDFKIFVKNNVYNVEIKLLGEQFYFQLPQLMSLGIANNFVLACVCAMKCGISASEISEKISHWSPSKWRGEIIKSSSRTYFADCYNANPAAFFDSLENFNRLFPDTGRLFVIGELNYDIVGSSAFEKNLKILESVHAKEGDLVVIIGENAPLLAESFQHKNVYSFSTWHEAENIVKEFSGVVYLKGHRFYDLENLIS